ncbi:MAG TPA: hypothetical protein VE269_08935 [Gaiellaceae bacterium]|nr:hypothetical protein [Gaiellaceae bacterium]
MPSIARISFTSGQCDRRAARWARDPVAGLVVLPAVAVAEAVEVGRWAAW